MPLTVPLATSHPQDVRLLNAGKPPQKAAEIERDLDKADAMIRLLFNDVQTLKDGRHPQGEQMYRRYGCAGGRCRRGTAHTACPTQGTLALAWLQEQPTTCGPHIPCAPHVPCAPHIPYACRHALRADALPARRVYRLHERLVAIRTEYNLRLKSGAPAAAVTVPLGQRPRQELDEATLRYLQDLLAWVEENQRRLGAAEWGVDLPTVESHLGSHRGLHHSIEEFRTKIERARADEVSRLPPGLPGAAPTPAPGGPRRAVAAHRLVGGSEKSSPSWPPRPQLCPLAACSGAPLCPGIPWMGRGHPAAPLTLSRPRAAPPLPTVPPSARGMWQWELALLPVQRGCRGWRCSLRAQLSPCPAALPRCSPALGSLPGPHLLEAGVLWRGWGAAVPTGWDGRSPHSRHISPRHSSPPVPATPTGSAWASWTCSTPSCW